MENSSTSYLKPDTSRSIIARSARGNRAHPRHVIVAGAGGGIGAALCARLSLQFPEITLTRFSRNPTQLDSLEVNALDLPLNLAQPEQINNTVSQVNLEPHPDWIFIASGWLHAAEMMPERTYRELEANHLERSFRINAIGPALLMKYLAERFKHTHTLKIGVLSARLGSISDNRLGGWHAYRASKAGLNMLIKNFAIEMTRNRPNWSIVGLQPGTTDTPLSRPFQRGLRTHLHSAEDTSRQLIRIMQALKPEHSGNLYDRDGIPFQP